MTGVIRVGIGGWTFEPWRGVFYPEGLAQRRELEFASRALSTIEINGTYYSTFKPESWRRWRDETPDDFVFSLKASRYCTNRKILAEAGPSIERFINQGLSELGAKLGPINWQLAPTKKFDPVDIEGFLKLLPKEHDGVRLRHALEVRHPSFVDKAFVALAERYKAAVVYAEGKDYPTIASPGAGFTYARIMTAQEDLPNGFDDKELQKIASQVRTWAKSGDVFIHFISGAKVRNPHAAQALIATLAGGHKPGGQAKPAGKAARKTAAAKPKPRAKG